MLIPLILSTSISETRRSRSRSEEARLGEGSVGDVDEEAMESAGVGWKAILNNE